MKRCIALLLTIAREAVAISWIWRSGQTQMFLLICMVRSRLLPGQIWDSRHSHTVAFYVYNVLLSWSRARARVCVARAIIKHTNLTLKNIWPATMATSQPMSKIQRQQYLMRTRSLYNFFLVLHLSAFRGVLGAPLTLYHSILLSCSLSLSLLPTTESIHVASKIQNRTMQKNENKMPCTHTRNIAQ